jgi:hypothetical protein
VAQNQNSSTVFCSITHGLYDPWIEILRSGQVPTWLANKDIPGFTIEHFHGIPGNQIVMFFDRLHERIRWTNRWVATPLKFLDEFFGIPLKNFIPTQKTSNRLSLRHPATQLNFLDIYATMKWKDLAIFEYFINNTADNFLFMTTTSSYIRPRKLLEVVSHLPKTEIYAGAVAYPRANFAAGNNRLFSRDVVLRILRVRKELKCGDIEDLAVGQLCEKLGLKLMELPKMNIASLKELSAISDLKISDNFHFRLKSGTIEKRDDVAIMLELHKRVRVIDEI